MVWREALDQVGLLDERFFIYGAEVDWYYRLKGMGWKVFYYSEAEIIHIGSQSTQQLQDEMGLERFHSRYMLFLKHKGKGYAWTYKALVFLVTVIKVLYFWIGLLCSTSGEKRRWYRRKVRLHRRVLWWIFGGDL
jgi:GT2 family glycosyltransferase